jgi:hypothetical protein
LVDRLERDASAGDLGEDVVAGGGPDEWLGVVVVGGEVVLDLGDEVGYGVDHAAVQRLVGQFPEPAFDQPEPRRRGGRHCPMTLPVSTSSAANNVAVPWRS